MPQPAEPTPELRQEICNAVNVCMQNGTLSRDFQFDFVTERGKLWVRLWRPDWKSGVEARDNNVFVSTKIIGGEAGIRFMDPREIILAAGSRPVIQGKREFF